MEGGAESGFRHVKPESYKPRLLHFSGVKNNIAVREVIFSVLLFLAFDVILPFCFDIYFWQK